jgi:putative heme transporter
MPPAGAPLPSPGAEGVGEGVGPTDAGGGVSGASGGVSGASGGVREMDLDWRSVAWAMAAFVAFVAVGNLVRAAPRAITVVIVGSLVALALTPVVGEAQRRLHLPRPAAVGIVVAGLLLVTAVAFALLAPPAVDQGRRVGRDLDEVVGQVEDLPFIGDDLRQAGAADKLRAWIEGLPDRLKGADTRIGEAARRTLDLVLVTFLTLLVSISLLLDGDRVVRGIRRLVPPDRRPQADRIGRLAYDTVGRYVAGSLLVAGIAGLSILVVGLVLGVPLTPLLAVWVALFDLVPQIGGAAGGVPFVLLGLTQGLATGIICAVFFILYLQFENHILSPLVVGRSVKLSPPATMTAALIGVSAAGVVGALVAVPVVASVKAIYVNVRQSRLEAPPEEVEATDVPPAATTAQPAEEPPAAG